MFEEHDEEVFAELERARELPEDLPHTVQEEQEYRSLPFLLAVGVG